MSRAPERSDVAFPVRVALTLLGWVLLAVGVAGLVLPGLQGVLTLVAGLAVLSLVSRRFHLLLRRLLSRWPRLWRRVLRFQRRARRRVSRH